MWKIVRKKMKWNGGQLINVSTFCKSWVAAKKSFNDPKRTNERCARIAKKLAQIFLLLLVLGFPTLFEGLSWKKFGNRCLGLKSRFLRNTKKKFQENYLNHSMNLMIKHLMMSLQHEFKEFSFHSKYIRLAFLVAAYHYILLMETCISARLEASAK